MAFSIKMGIPEMAELWNRLQTSYRDGTINKKDTEICREIRASGLRRCRPCAPWALLNPKVIAQKKHLRRQLNVIKLRF